MLAAASCLAWLAIASASLAATPGLAGPNAVRLDPAASGRLVAGGVVLEADPASVDTLTEVSVAPIAEPDLVALDPGMTNVTAQASGFRFSPHGARFRKPLRLTLSYDPTRLPPGTTPADVQAFYFDEAIGHWMPLDDVGVDPVAHSVHCLTDHFTDIIAATLVVPTHPELSSFVPTTMQNMQTADPAQGLELIQPPQPDPSGEARLSFPLDLPRGRNGMQPFLALSYHSQGGEGWMGLGWNVDVADIEVDTRCGVPRYGVVPDASGALQDRNLETESYLFDGRELTPLANRTAFQARVGPDAVFHARVEGAFDRIVRHGDHPSRFWWEVTDRNGTTSYYGDVPFLDGPGTLRDERGNIFRWALREVRDLHGNTLRFDYDLAEDAPIAGGTTGRQLYLNSINYTGTAEAGAAGEPGAYTVRFIRDSDPSLAPWTHRHDVAIDCRGGFEQVTAQLLRRIRVELDGERIREYQLDYRTGAFGKTLLAAIRVFGADGEPFPGADHHFTYYDDVGDGSGDYSRGFAAASDWNVPSDDVTLCTDLGPVDLCPTAIVPGYDRASALSGSITHGIGGHAYVGLNCGLPTKEDSGGLKAGFDYTRTESQLGLFDVNGDGLPDKVFRSGSQVFYRANEDRPGGTPSFSATRYPIPGISDFSIETASTLNGGAEAYFLGTTLIANVSHTQSLGTTYTTDANGDGLLDVVQDGQILYSHLAPDGQPVFEPTSANTPQPLTRGALDGGLIQDYDPMFQDLLDQDPLHDVFRRWRAPWDGFVRISGGVRLESPSESADGVRVSIQRNENVVWSEVIPAGDAQVHLPVGVDRLAVSRGDRIYFRAQSVFDGSNDAVSWDPAIDYLDVPAAPDVNRLDQHHYRASEDFVLAGRPAQTRMPYNGQVRIRGTFEKSDTTSDDVALVVLRNGTEIYRGEMPWDTTGTVTLDLTVTVTADDTTTTDVKEADRIEVRVRVDSPIDVRRVGWLPDAPVELVYESSPDVPVEDSDGNPLIRILLPWDVDLYPADDLTGPQETWVAPADGTLSVSTKLSGDWSFRDLTLEQPVADGTIAFTVKRDGALLAKRILEVTNGAVGNASLGGIAVSKGDRLYFDATLLNGVSLGSVGARVRDASDANATPADVPVALHTNVPFDDVPVLGRGLFAQPYRGWTCAGYNGNPPRDSDERPHACTGPRVAPTEPIDEADLVIPDSQLQGRQRPTPLQLAQAVQDQKAYVFSPVTERLADGSLRMSWRGPADAGWVLPASLSSCRLGADFVGVPCPNDVGGDASVDGRAVPRIGVSNNVGGAAGFFIAVSGSDGRCRSDLDFIDLNGDQFPEPIGNGKAQFTLPDGGLELHARALASTDPVRDAHNLVGSVSLGGTVPSARGGARGTLGANDHAAPRGERAANNMPSLGFSGDLGAGSSTTNSELVDVNGDGLPDRVHDDGTVELNLGYSFAAAVAWPGLSGLDESKNREFSLGAGLGFNNLIYGWAGGLSYSRAESNTQRTLLDLNGDGLADRLRVDGGGLSVAFNNGSGFEPETRWQGATLAAVASTASATLGGGAFVTIPVPIFMCSPVTVLFLIINPGATVSSGMAREEAALIDVDGDGYADYVASSRDDQLSVSRNQTGRTNLLRRVERPLGGSFTLDYARQGNTPEMPRSIWALSRIELDDGVEDDGPSPLLTTLAYDVPRYDRSEREFYGFGEVREEHRSAASPEKPYRIVARSYLTDNFYDRGLIEREATLDGDGRPFRSISYRYDFHDGVTGAPAPSLSSHVASIAPLLAATTTTLSEGAGASPLESERTFGYDAVGNVIQVVDRGDPGPDDDLEALITYAPCEASHVLSRPDHILVRCNGVTLAERQATVDCDHGDQLQVRELLDQGVAAVTDLDYLPSGEVRSVTGPVNRHGDRYQRRYEYDPHLGTYVTRIEDSFGLASTASYDLRFGAPTETRDANGNLVSYTYDPLGRTTAVTGPYEQGTGHATLSFEYHPDAQVPWARTRHFDVQRGAADPIETIQFTDGLGRLIQTKVDATVHDPNGGPAQDVRVVSGRVRYDAFGRAAEQFQPVTEPLGQGPVFDPAFDPIAPTRTEYDVLDRPTRIVEPDGSITTYAYGLGIDRDDRPAEETTITDPNGRRRHVFRDTRDLLVGVREEASPTLWTSYEYDALDRLVGVRDALGHQTRAAYDLLGRRTMLSRPDAGTTRFEYDPASNLVELRTANMTRRHAAIRYDYEFGRLRAVHYTDHPENDVTYAYGAAGASDNAAGRVTRITDEAGTEQRAYGRLGEVVLQRRTLADHKGWNHRTPQCFETRYDYDTWGRLLDIVYPDDEKVHYDYDAGGLVCRVTGDLHGRVTEYVHDLEYDKFRQEIELELGNGVRTVSSYRPQDQRLDRLTTTSGADTLQNLHYEYDIVGNLRSVANQVSAPRPGKFGGPTLQQFEYDDLYRLERARGSYATGHHKVNEYTLELTYDALHNIRRLTRTNDVAGRSEEEHEPLHDTSCDLIYRYDDERPHAPVRVGDREFRYDADGNQIGWENEHNGMRRRIEWDDEDRIQSITDRHQEIRYAYDSRGERVLKRGPHGEIAYINQFFSIRNHDLATKNIYVGGTRIASRLISHEEEDRDGSFGASPRAGEREHERERDLYFYHPDQIGSTQFVTDGQGVVTQHLEYFPFGEVWVDEARGPPGGVPQFSSRELDSDTDLYYFGSRYQDPRLGQFLSVDPMSQSADEPAAMSSAGLNVYAYAYENPIRLVDPSGLSPSWWSRLRGTPALFRGASGPSLDAGRAGTPGSAVFEATDSPVRAGAASGIADFAASGAVGVIGTAPEPGAGVDTPRQFVNIASAEEILGGSAPATPPIGGSSARRPRAVLGENMAGRVTPYAKSIGAETIVDWLGGKTWTQELNDAYIHHLMDENYEVIDIGPDFARRLRFKLDPPSDRGPRPVYESEREILGDYPYRRQVYNRARGGVPVLDYHAETETDVKGIE